ncbi:metallophosphoesterase family protein [Paenibacillus sp. 7541]|uniref:metallophosphoesterase family protein n=1 Tax=Paenibacillus sp. 7541 TaxID=2026236 RepID=UPI000BA795B2|nr:metallophosphoesterase family protein [Paenibacillus sp. 7541]PAK54528.1 serine/threonine protein phosphatase [Paenibacillus sp. 7541]
MRTIVISDIHGCYDEFNTMLEKVRYRPAEDQLLLLGDYVDRGMKSKDVVEQVIKLHEQAGAVVLKGNHDDMMLKALLEENARYQYHWLSNGGSQTLLSYCSEVITGNIMEPEVFQAAKTYILEHYRHHLDFLQSLPLYHEGEKHIFVHAGTNPAYPDWKEQPGDDFMWIRDAFYNHPTGLGKTVVFGHTPTFHLHHTGEVWFSPHGDKIGIDGACAYGHRLLCLEIGNDDEYKTYAVPNAANEWPEDSPLEMESTEP